jgi:hypothetical protein
MDLEISKLMDHYTDTEFCPREGVFADPQAVRERVLAQVRPGRRKKRLGGKLLLVAAVAAVCMGLMATAYGIYSVRYVSPAGAVLEGENGTATTGQVGCGEVVVLEEGRLWFVADGQRVDLTGLADGSTAYTYVTRDPDTGAVSNLIVGGTPEDFGWCEIFQTPNAGSMGSGENFVVTYANIDGTWVKYADLHIPEEEEVEFFQTHETTIVRQNWYADGLTKLGLSDPYGPIEGE